MKPHTCQHCAFWQPFDNGSKGECRINPPQIVPALWEADDDDIKRATGLFPITPDDGWCGEWQAMSLAPWDGERIAAE